MVSFLDDVFEMGKVPIIFPTPCGTKFTLLAFDCTGVVYVTAFVDGSIG